MSLIFPRQRTAIEKIEAILFSAEVQALILFRLSHWFNQRNLTRKLRLDKMTYRLNQFLNHVDIDPQATLGKNLLMPHPGGIVIGATAVIDDDVTIMQNVTIGSRRIGEPGKRHATIEQGVFIGPNAIILGDIKICKNAKIGAGSIVLENVEEDQVVYGIHRKTD